MEQELRELKKEIYDFQPKLVYETLYKWRKEKHIDFNNPLTRHEKIFVENKIPLFHTGIKRIQTELFWMKIDAMEKRFNKSLELIRKEHKKETDTYLEIIYIKPVKIDAIITRLTT